MIVNGYPDCKLMTVSCNLVVSQQEDPVQSSLNFCRLILLYIKGFECTDVERALDYAYFLNKMESPVGKNVLI